MTELEQLALDPLVPQPWFSIASLSISAVISALTGGLPIRFGYVHFRVTSGGASEERSRA